MSLSGSCWPPQHAQGSCVPLCSQVTSPLLDKPGSFGHTPITAVDMMLPTLGKQAKERGLQRDVMLQLNYGG